ncbi:hypothetical protein HG530_005525 [Fusarium avenaceum]|nr:hypothetical protein HG530_005525 [Fusarium avenaceum]
MSSPSSFTTLLSQATSTTWMPTSHDESSIHKSDKPVIIGLTIGVVFLAHWQQKRIDREARERIKKATIAPERPAAEV